MEPGPLEQLSRPQTLRNQLTERLRELLISGHWPAGSRVNEVQVAAQLGVSATPVREALLGLQHEGYLRSHPNRGFLVAELRSEDLRQLAAALSQLEAGALRLGGPPEVELLNELGHRNRRLQGHAEWHELLVSRCPNPYLVARIGELRGAIRRYENAYLPVHGPLPVPAAHHAALIRHLRAGELEAAAEQLRHDHLESVEPIARTLS